MVFTSQDSEDLSGFAVEILDDDELVALVADLRKQIRFLRLENEVLEKSILRLDPALMNGVYQALEYATKPHTGIPGTSSSTISSFNKSTTMSKFGLIESLLCPSKMFASKSSIFTRRMDSSGRMCGSIITGQGPKINLNEKLELLYMTIEYQERDLEKCRNNSTKRHAYLRAELEKTDIWTTDIEKSTLEFKQEVVTEGWDPITQRVPAEIWIRFMAEWAKKTDRQIGRLRLRTSTLNIQYRKLKEEVERKRDMKESLTPVDFDKIKIENQEALKLLENKNIQLDELKAMTGDANLNLAIHKKAMLFLDTYLEKVKRLKTHRENQTVALDNEISLIQIQVDILTQRLSEIKKMRMDYHIPNINDYVNVKAKINELNYTIKRLETKLHIKQTAVASATCANKRLKTLFSKRSLISSSDSFQML